MVWWSDQRAERSWCSLISTSPFPALRSRVGGSGWATLTCMHTYLYTREMTRIFEIPEIIVNKAVQQASWIKDGLKALFWWYKPATILQEKTIIRAPAVSECWVIRQSQKHSIQSLQPSILDISLGSCRICDFKRRGLQRQSSKELPYAPHERDEYPVLSNRMGFFHQRQEPNAQFRGSRTRPTSSGCMRSNTYVAVSACWRSFQASLSDRFGGKLHIPIGLAYFNSLLFPHISIGPVSNHIEELVGVTSPSPWRCSASFHPNASHFVCDIS